MADQIGTFDHVDIGGHRLRKRQASGSAAPQPPAAKRQHRGSKNQTTAANPSEESESDDGEVPGNDANGDDNSVEGAGSDNGTNGDSSNGGGDPDDSDDGSDDGSTEEEEDPEDMLLKEVPIIEKKNPAEVVDFFKDWAAKHQAQTWSQWLDFYTSTTKPAFYHDDEWDEIINRHKLAEEAGNTGGCERLETMRSIMSELVESGNLEACSHPDEFMKTAEWEKLRANLESLGKEQEILICDRLQTEMLNQAVARRVAPQGPHEFFCDEDWSTVIYSVPLKAEEDRRKAQMVRMICRVLAGETPYSFSTYFKVDEWARELDEHVAEANELLKLQNQMRLAVCNGELEPYGPDWLFRRPEWSAAINAATGQRQGNLQTLFATHRADVLARNSPGNALWRICNVETAEWKAEWIRIRDFLVASTDPNAPQVADTGAVAADDEEPIDAAAVQRTYEIVNSYDTRYDERIEPLVQGAHESARHYWAKLRGWVSMRMNVFDTDTYTDAILQRPDHVEKRRLVADFVVMQKEFAEKTISRRAPASAPPDYVAIAKRIGYGRDTDGLWRLGGKIGSGGFGTCTYWVKVDKNYRVIDRKVLKDTYPKSLWDRADTWYGNINNRMPLEMHIVELLKALPDSEHIIAYDHHEIHANRRMYRIYMEYCEHGTLHDLIKQHWRLEEAHQNGTAKTEGEDVNYRIPVRFLWSIFEGLAAALCLAHENGLPDPNRTSPPTDPVMHRDIKPDNIFLAAPAPDTHLWRELPVVKLADWGLACMANAANATNKLVGTEGWQAPEQHIYQGHQNTQYPQLPSRKSDIWAVGRVMLALVTRSNDARDQLFTSQPLNLPPSLNVIIGRPMCDLIRECLTQDPDDRIECDELYTRIARQVETLRFAPRGYSETLLYSKNKYDVWGR